MSDSSQASPDLQSLVEVFYDSPSEVGEFVSIQKSQMPADYQKLLAHSGHMTVTVEEFYGTSVDVQVLEKQETATHYSRKILLRRHDNQKVVQFGIVRLHKSSLEDSVRREILREEQPLGRILIQHGVLRTVFLLGLWKIQMGLDLQKAFGVSRPVDCYGRTALIYCDSFPSVELLEVVYIS